MYKNMCIVCSKTFQHTHSHVKVCESCRKIKLKLICEYCGKEFLANYNGRKKFCSKECKSKGISKAIRSLQDKEIKCESCGEIFIVKGCSKTKLCFDCRKICYLKNKYKPIGEIYKICKKCGDEFLTMGNKIYCNSCSLKYECKICKERFLSRKAFSKHMLKVHQKLAKNGYVVINPYKKQEIKKNTKIVMPKVETIVTYNDGICSYCRKNKSETFHHIYPRKFGGPSTLENCICLCYKCHDKIEILTDDLFKQSKYFTIKELESFIFNKGFPNEKEK